ncbi:hypothetical protein CPB86DRAFT_878600 [Serendipita vermifera]|nr:hypothetical protein CPB86DRAFT_878600 [Serendipita vermifera]
MTYRAGVLLSGILYLHRITDNRAGGVAVRNFSMFRKLCGAETLKNVVIATTMWQKEEREVALEREEELRNDPKFFKHAIGSGASLRRHDGSLQSAQALLRELVKNSPSALRVQRQVVDEKKDLDQTDAGIELAQEQQRIVEKYEKKMKELERTMRDSNRAERELLEKERKDMENHQRRVKEEQENMARDFRAQQERMRQMEEEQRRLLQQAEGAAKMKDLISVWNQLTKEQAEYRASHRYAPRADGFTTYQSPDEEYTGDENLIMAIDLGTTQTAVSFVHLYPGEVPRVQMVNEWPGQAMHSGSAKVPSLVSYKNRRAVAYGEEAATHLGNSEYKVAKWFKLYLHPQSMKSSSAGKELTFPPLPTGVDLKTIYADFLKFLYKSTGEFFRRNLEKPGSSVWNRLQGKTEFIFATPNGWDARQQGFLRDAAVQGGLLPSQGADDRIGFITEAEASVHFAMAHSDSRDWMRPGVVFAILDAGGSTVDTTLYRCKSAKPHLKLEEVKGSECVQAGGVCVDDAAEKLLKEKLQGSSFAAPEKLSLIVRKFEEKTKRMFDGVETRNTIPFGNEAVNDPKHGIQRGRITLSLAEMKQTFDGSVEDTLSSCSRLFEGQIVKNLIIVGGFGESVYLRKRLREKLSRDSVQVTEMEEPGNKAAAEGAAIWAITQIVVGRAVRYTHGTRVAAGFDSSSSIHNERSWKKYVDIAGDTRIPDLFDPLVKKDTILDDASPVLSKYITDYESYPSYLGSFGTNLYVWEGLGHTNWCADTSGNLLPDMHQLCTIQADLSNIKPSQRSGPKGAFWRIDFEVAIFFEGAKMKARLEWMENGVKKQGPVTVVPALLY